MPERRAAIYVRISQDREGAGLGVERQRADCEALAKRLGWSVVSTFTDNDLSAYSGKRRPGYRALLADLDAGRADAVLAWHTDRLHRSPRELEEYVDVCERRGVVTHTVKAGEIDLSTPSGRAVARTLGAWARFEVEHKSDRTKRAQLQAAEAGRWFGGARPFGWEVREHGEAVIDRREAEVIRKCTHAVLAGASLGSLAAELNSRAVLTSTGKQWNATTLRQVLRRARNAGLSTYNGEVVGKSTWPALITEDTWRALCAVLDDPERRRSSSNRLRWLLPGLATCGACGDTVRTATVASNRAAGTTRTVYRCRVTGRGHVARAAQPVDDFVTRLVVARLSRPEARQLLAAGVETPDAEGLRVEAVALRARLGEAAESFADGAITAGQLEKISARVRARLDEVESAMARSARGVVLADLVNAPDVAAVWETLALDRRRAVISELMTVSIMPTGRRGNVFDPTSVRVGWKAS